MAATDSALAKHSAKQARCSSIDLTQELSQLVLFAGDVATVIRMYGCYENSFSQMDKHDNRDAVYLADALHHFRDLGERILSSIKTGCYQDVVFMAEDIIDIYSNTYGSDLKADENFSFRFHNPQTSKLVDFKLAISALEKIIYKCKKRIS